jgi:hypothetical protein
MTKTFIKTAAIAIAASVISTAALAAGEHEAPMTELAKSGAVGWIKDPAVVEAIKAQNGKTGGLSEAEIIKMDKQWRAEVKGSGGPMIEGVLKNALSDFLKKVKADSQGKFTEIFVMDGKGLNVGQSDVTSDYWQGDEAKWQKTYKVGASAIHIGKVSMDELTQTLQSQLSLPIVDPANNAVIGAVTIGVNVEALGQ